MSYYKKKFLEKNNLKKNKRIVLDELKENNLKKKLYL